MQLFTATLLRLPLVALRVGIPESGVYRMHSLSRSFCAILKKIFKVLLVKGDLLRTLVSMEAIQNVKKLAVVHSWEVFT